MTWQNIWKSNKNIESAIPTSEAVIFGGFFLSSLTFLTSFTVALFLHFFYTLLTGTSCQIIIKRRPLMKTFLLYCDLATMNCTSNEINETLQSFAESFSQVNDSLWFFKYDVAHDLNPLPKEEHLFYDHFERFTNKNSIIFIEQLSGCLLYTSDAADEQ